MLPRIYRVGMAVAMLALAAEALGAGRKWT
jgi:hypothetical protein